MWPIVRINWERSRYVYNLFYKKDKDDGEEPISRQLSAFLVLSVTLPCASYLEVQMVLKSLKFATLPRQNDIRRSLIFRKYSKELLEACAFGMYCLDLL